MNILFGFGMSDTDSTPRNQLDNPQLKTFFTNIQTLQSIATPTPRLSILGELPNPNLLEPLQLETVECIQLLYSSA